MKKLLLLLAAFCCVTAASAQKKDIIYLKNGSIIKGTIVEMADSKVKVSTKDGSVFVFGMDEIDRMAKEEKQGFMERNGNPSADKWNFGVTAGYVISSNNWTTHREEGWTGDESVGARGRMPMRFRHGFTVGGNAVYMPFRRMAFEAGAMFAMSGYNYYDGKSGYDMKVTNYSVDIPVSAVYYFGGVAKNKWHVLLGLTPTFAVAGKLSINDDFLEDLRKFNKNYNPEHGNTVPLFNINGRVGVGYGPVRLTAYYSIMSSMTDEFKKEFKRSLFRETDSAGYYGATLTYTYWF